MRRLVCLVLCSICVPVPLMRAQQGNAPRFSIPPPSEWVEIDGSKNPELIPQWSIWQRGLQVLARSRDLPTTVLQQFTREEIDLLTSESAAEVKREGRCRQRVLELRPLLATEPVRVIDEKTRAIQLECRQETLDARDRLLARLGPEAQFALTDWIEGFKAGTRVSIPKKELPHYLKPQ